MWRLTQRPSKTHGKVCPSSSLTFEFPNFQQAGVFMGFSITSAVFGGIIIISYSFGIVSITTFDYGIYDYSYRHGNYYHYRTKVTTLAIMLVLGLVTFGTGIWAAICTCLMKPCTACSGQPQVSKLDEKLDLYKFALGKYVAEAAERFEKLAIRIPLLKFLKLPFASFVGTSNLHSI